MIKLTELLEEQELKKLRVFDFDDTIATTKSKVILTDRNGNMSKLTPAEFAIYREQPGDNLDFSEFDRVISPQEIKSVTNILRKLYTAAGRRRITVLTARTGVAANDIKQFLQTIGINNIEVVGVGSSDPQAKADWIEGKIQQGYNDVFFIDDARPNVMAVKKLAVRYPDVKWNIKLADYMHELN